MQKLVKNWIFTLIVCILLAMFAVLLVIDNLGLLGERYVAYSVLHVLTAVALAVYVVLALCPMVPRYKNGSGRLFLLIEIAVLLVTVVSQIGVEFFRDLPLLSDLPVCSVLGLALWLRASVLTLRAYLLQGIAANVPLVAEQTDAPAPAAPVRVPLWRVCLYILLGAVGVWQMVSPLIKDKHIVYGIAAAAAVFATIFAVLTVQNQKEWRKTHPKPVKLPVPVAAEDQAVVPVEAPAEEGAPAPAAEVVAPVAEPPAAVAETPTADTTAVVPVAPKKKKGAKA